MSYWDELDEIVKVSPGHYEPRRHYRLWPTWKQTMAYYAKRLKPKPPKPTLDELLEKARHHVMTDDEKEAQRQSWGRGEMALAEDENGAS